MSASPGWIGVDFDGTLAYYDGWRGEDHIGAPISAMVGRVKAWLAEGMEVRIVTARCFHPSCIENGFHVASMSRKEALDAIKKWCVQHIGRELPIQCYKDYGMIELWDDRAVQVMPNLGTRADEREVIIDIPTAPVEIIDIPTERPAAPANPAPKDRGDIIGWGAYTGSHAKSIVYVDFVSDPILYKASKGLRGWMSVRTEPTAMDDQEMGRQVRNLQNYIMAKVVCGLEVLTGGAA